MMRKRDGTILLLLVLLPFLGCIGQPPEDPGAVTVTVTDIVEKTTIMTPEPIVITTTRQGEPTPPETTIEYREVPVTTTIYEESVITLTEQGPPRLTTTTKKIVKTTTEIKPVTTTVSVTITRTNIPDYYPYSLTGQGGAVDTLLIVGLVLMGLLLWRRRRQ